MDAKIPVSSLTDIEAGYVRLPHHGVSEFELMFGRLLLEKTLFDGRFQNNREVLPQLVDQLLRSAFFRERLDRGDRDHLATLSIVYRMRLNGQRGFAHA